MLNRRDMIKLAAVGGAASILPFEEMVTAAEPAPPATSRPFVATMPIPPVLAPSADAYCDRYEITMKRGQVELIPGLTSTVYGYNGLFPGPTILARQGRPVRIRQVNELAVPTGVHLHGGKVPAAHDGHPTATIAPGASRVYEYPNNQPAAPLWYHDHAHMIEGDNVYSGLHASYLVTDLREQLLPLPRGEYDVPLQIRDARILADGTLTYTRAQDRPHVLVNGKERPRFEVAARKYRFRVANMSVDRPFQLRFADDSEFVLIGTDGGFLAAPVTVRELLLGAGERADIVVDFSRYPVGTKLVLVNGAGLATENPDVMRFDVMRPAADPSRVPTLLADVPVLPRPTVERRFVLSQDWTRGALINGNVYDPERVDVRTRLGTTELWTITNADPSGPPPNFHLNHSFHTHLADFRILDRNGRPPAPTELGRKDVVRIAPGDTVRIAMTWAGYPGRYVFHCHQLPHSEWGQMATIELV
jgi:spore coat protein A